MASGSRTDRAPAAKAPRASGRQNRTKLSASEQATEWIIRVLHRVFALRLFRVLTLDPTNLPDSFSAETCGYEGHFFEGAELDSLIGKHRELGRNFVTRSKLKGDWCQAYLVGDQVVSYSWYSTTPTRIGEQFEFEFPEDFIYVYHGFTRKNYRGARLNGHGMAEAARSATSQGKLGLVGLVEAQNTASLRSAERVGYRRVGSIVLFRLAGRWMTFRTPACRNLGAGLRRR